MIVRFSAAAEAELTKAVAYYDAQMPGLGCALLDEAEAALKRIAAFPEAWQRLSANTRRCRLHRFPYGLIYRVRHDTALVIAVGHLHREPEHWRDRE